MGERGRTESARETRESLTKRLFVSLLAERQRLISKEGLRMEGGLSAAHRHKGGDGER